MALKKIDIKISGKAVSLYLGRYPDLRGKSHDLLIREGHVGLWKDDKPVEDYVSGEHFYEVVTNRKLISQVMSAL